MAQFPLSAKFFVILLRDTRYKDTHKQTVINPLLRHKSHIHLYDGSLHPKPHDTDVRPKASDNISGHCLLATPANSNLTTFELSPHCIWFTLTSGTVINACQCFSSGASDTSVGSAHALPMKRENAHAMVGLNPDMEMYQAWFTRHILFSAPFLPPPVFFLF